MTAQIPDVLEFQGQRHRLFTNPLDALPRDRQPAFVSENSACWRGYVACWEVRDDRLYLKDLHGTVCIKADEDGADTASCGRRHRGVCETRDVRASDLFDMSERPVLADWFSGELRIPQGRLLNYVHMGYGSQYERYLVIAIANGRVEASRIDSSPPQASSRPGFLARLAARLGAGMK